MKADSIGSQVAVMKTRGGALMTDCVMGSYATGGVPDLDEGIHGLATVDRSFSPNPENTVFYRRTYDLRENALKEGMKSVFGTLRSL